MNGHRPAKLAALFCRVDEATAALSTAAEEAAAAIEAAVTDNAHEITASIAASPTQRWLRSLAYAKGIAAEAAALDAEVPLIAAQILADRSPVVAYDRASGTLASLIALIAPQTDSTVTIRVALPPEVREIYATAAAAAGQSTEHLIGRYLDRIAYDAYDRGGSH